MLKYDGFVLRKIDDPEQGNVVTGVSVAVRKVSDGTLADLFSDALGGSSKANPLTTDSNGRYFFYAANGVYNIDVADGSASQQISLVDTAETSQEISDAITNHVNAVDPHTQYAKESDLGTASTLDVGSDPTDIPQVQDLADVAFSGDYNDLLNRPVAPEGYSPEYTPISTSATLVVNSKNKIITSSVVPKLPSVVGLTHKDFVTVTHLRGITFNLQSFANDNVINTTAGDTNQMDYTSTTNVYEDTYIFNSITSKWEL
jgi:hypothetical protein